MRVCLSVASERKRATGFPTLTLLRTASRSRVACSGQTTRPELVMTVPLTAPLLVIPPDATPTATLAILAKTKRRIIGPQSVKAAAIKAGAFEQSVGIYGRQDLRLTTRSCPDSSSCSALPTQMQPLRKGQPRIRCLLCGLKPRASSLAFPSVSANAGRGFDRRLLPPRLVRS